MNDMLSALALVVATGFVHFAFVVHRRTSEEAFEELFDAQCDNPVAEHRYAVYDEERAYHNRERDCAADGVEEGEEAEDDFKNRENQKRPPVGNVASACRDCKGQFRNAFHDEPHCKDEGQKACHDAFVCEQYDAENGCDYAVREECAATHESRRGEESRNFHDAYHKHDCADDVRKHGHCRVNGQTEANDACHNHQYTCQKP